MRKKFSKKIDSLKERKDKVKEILQSLYSDYVDGVFTEAEYMDVKKSYIEELSGIESDIEKVKAEEETWLVGYEGNSAMSRAFNKYAGFEKLTNEIVKVFISKIYCYAGGRMEVEYSFEDGLTKLIQHAEGRDLK